MTVVYLDKVFFINALIDYFLLLAAVKLGGVSIQRFRLAICSFFGGLYSIMVFLPPFSLLDHSVIRSLFGVLMAVFAFVGLPHLWRLVALFLLLSCTLGGLLLAVNIALGSNIVAAGYGDQPTMAILLGVTGIAYIFLQFFFRQGARHGGGELMEIVISVSGRQQRVLALHDTGNTLRDPVSGRPVLVVEQTALFPFWGQEIHSILQSAVPAEEKMVRLYQAGAGNSFTLLPFRSVGTASGLLLATRSEYIKIGNETYQKILVALSSVPLSDGGTYQALWGGEAKEAYHEALAKGSNLAHQTQKAG